LVGQTGLDAFIVASYEGNLESVEVLLNLEVLLQVLNIGPNPIDQPHPNRIQLEAFDQLSL
jgi:hypothetical protein